MMSFTRGIVEPMAQGTGLLLALSPVLCKEAHERDIWAFAAKPFGFSLVSPDLGQVPLPYRHSLFLF